MPAPPALSPVSRRLPWLYMAAFTDWTQQYTKTLSESSRRVDDAGVPTGGEWGGGAGAVAPRHLVPPPAPPAVTETVILLALSLAAFAAFYAVFIKHASVAVRRYRFALKLLPPGALQEIPYATAYLAATGWAERALPDAPDDDDGVAFGDDGDAL